MKTSSEFPNNFKLEMKIKGVGLGSSYIETIKKLGKPAREKKDGPFTGCYGDELETELVASYPGLTINFVGDAKGRNFKVEKIEVSDNKWIPASGIKIGTSSASIKEILGKSEFYDVNGLQALSYINDGNDGSAVFYFKHNKLVKIQWMYESC